MLIKPSTVPCLDQSAGQSHNTKIDNSPLKGGTDKNILEQPERIKILFRKKLRAD